MKFSKSQTYSRVHKVPEIKFEDQSLTSFAGLAVFMPLLRRLGLKERLGRCFPRRKGSPIYAAATIALGLIIHIIIGFHRLRDVEYYGDDPMVKRLLGLKRLPSAATISRSLREMDAGDYERVRELSRELVCDRIVIIQPSEVFRRSCFDKLSTNGKMGFPSQRFPFVLSLSKERTDQIAPFFTSLKCYTG